jgi:hypothetical protein
MKDPYHHSDRGGPCLLFWVLAMGLVLAACGPSASKRKQNLDDTLSRYASAIRWGDFAGATSFLDPHIDKSKLPTRLDMARYENLRISAYVPQPIQPGPDENSIVQNVRISFYNRFTNRERSIIDHQQWRYDEEKQRWYLTSGLPKVTHE